MTKSSCLDGLVPAGPQSPDDGASYYSRGAVLLICDGLPEPGLFQEPGAPGPMLVVSPSPMELGLTPAVPRIDFVQGRVAKLHGWLGAFRVEFADLAPGTPRRPGPNRDGTFDVVIDLSASPLFDRSVPPPGYFAPRDAAEFKSALDRARELKGSFTKPKYFDYQPGLCAHASYGQAGCIRCLSVCGADAISSTGDHVAVNANLCQGCGACTLACPTGALSFRAPARADLLNRLEAALEGAAGTGPTLVVHAPDREQVWPTGSDWISFPVAPVAAFGEELWFAALALGAARIVIIDPEAPVETAGLHAARVAVAESILQACGYHAGTIQGVATVAGVDSPYPRRLAPDRQKLSAAGKRPLLLRALERLEPDSGFEPRALPAGAPLGTIQVDERRCTLCSACARICPTGAIDYSDERATGLARLSFLEELCVQCGACANGCPERAIELAPRIASLEIRSNRRAVAEDPLARCADCGAGFVAGKLLAVNVRRAENSGTPMAAVEQLKRCPDCRHRRISEN